MTVHQSGAPIDFQALAFAYKRSPDQDAATPVRHPVVIVGAGPVGLATAIDLAQHQIPVVLIDDDTALSNGSRAICFAKRTLEISDRLGCGERMVDKGVVWQTGKVFFGDEQIYSFDLLPEEGHRRPAFVNLQQYYVEGFMLERAQEFPNLDIRWNSRLAGLREIDGGVELTIETPEGKYDIQADWLVASDGGRSATRQLMGLESKGRTFRDRFLIADVKMKAEFPAERWFWFDPPFHRGQSVLLHKQPDDVWRIDFQLGWDADPVAEREPERVIPRVQALLGKSTAFDLEWISVYSFVCLRMDKFRHGHVLFAGDSAHGVSPFGARGANSGIQDADNLAWKLRLVIEGRAPDALLDSYDAERSYAADENILNSTRSTDFITPKNEASLDFRNATLELARDFAFARRIVNSGRLSVPAVLVNSPLNTPDTDAFTGKMVPGAVAADAPMLEDGHHRWLLSALGDSFKLVVFVADASTPVPTEMELKTLGEGIGAIDLVIVAMPSSGEAARRAGATVLEDVDGLAAKRYDATSGTIYLVRPDQHISARFRTFDLKTARRALLRAVAHS